MAPNSGRSQTYTAATGARMRTSRRSIWKRSQVSPGWQPSMSASLASAASEVSETRCRRVCLVNCSSSATEFIDSTAFSGALRARTVVPMPARAVTRPRSRRWRIAARTVWRLTRKRASSSASVGRRAPTA